MTRFSWSCFDLTRFVLKLYKSEKIYVKVTLIWQDLSKIYFDLTRFMLNGFWSDKIYVNVILIWHDLVEVVLIWQDLC